MKRYLLLLVALMFSLACQTIMGGPAYGSGNIPAEPTQTINNPAAPKGITIVQLHRQGGNLADQLAIEAEKAAALGQQPVAYFEANW